MAALAEALSALDRAAKVGAIHPNAAARRKSRLTRKVNAALGGEQVQTGGRVVKTTGKAAAAKAAKARIAAGKAGKAKGAQTAAGKARAALSKTARAEAAAAKAAAEARATEAAPAKATAAKAATKATAKAAPKKTAAAKTAPKPAAKAAAEGDRQGRAQGEEGHDQEVAGPGLDRPDPTTTPRLSPGRFDSWRRRPCDRWLARPRAGRGRLRPEDPVERRRRPAPPSAVRTRIVTALPNCSLQ